MDQEFSLKVTVAKGTASARAPIRGTGTDDGLHQGIGHFFASSTRVECFFVISSSSAFDTGSIFSFCLKVYDLPDSRYAFGRDFLLGLHMNERLGYLEQLLQHSVLNQIGNVPRVPRGPTVLPDDIVSHGRPRATGGFLL